MDRVLIAGCGGMSGLWMKILQKLGGVDVVGLVDLDMDRARKRAREFEIGECVFDTEVESAIAACQPEVVIDLTPPATHHRVATAALRAGCHLMSEKPLANSMREAIEIVDLARASGRVHAVMQNRRYDPNIRRFASFLRSGALGRVTTLHADFHTGPRFDGFRLSMEHVLLLDMAVHHFDAARYVLGCNPVTVICHEWNPPESWFAHGASAVAVFRMEDDSVYTYRGSWAADGFNTTWECDWRAVAARGSVLWDGAQSMKAQRVVALEMLAAKCEAQDIPPPPADARIGGHEGCIADFLDCIRNGGTPETTVEDNIISLAMVFGAIQSAETGRPVNIPNLLKER